jgi:uncharacterized integral membrane protein (TIGR00698 family)
LRESLRDPVTTRLVSLPVQLFQQARSLWPGTAASAVIAVAATALASLHSGPQLLYALLLGVAFHYLSTEPLTKPGIEFCGRGLLRLGVALLGARITADQIVGLGWQTALTVVAAVATTMLCGLAVGAKLGMTLAQRVLSGGAVAICGASAALAISSVLPREKNGERFTLMVVVTVTVMSTLAMVLYPFITRALNLPPELAGFFIGTTIHDVAQVVGAGYMISNEAGDIATIVKLFRVALLAVVVMVVSVAFKAAREQAQGEAQAAHSDSRKAKPQSLIPWFLWLFIAIMALNSAGLISSTVQSALNATSRACLVTAIAALGMKTSFQQLARAGWKPMALILVETLWIAGFVLCLIWLRR